MSEKPRIVDGSCDFCEINGETQEVLVIILEDKTPLLLCSTHLAKLKKFCQRIGVKWSEITL